MEHPLDHVAIAVPSISVALPVFESLSGSKGSPIEAVPEQRVNVCFVGAQGTRIELIEPAAPDSPVSRFLEKRGSGLHHIAYRVPDIAAALEAWTKRGYQALDAAPRMGAHGRLVAFLHPHAAHGVLVELVQEAR